MTKLKVAVIMGAESDLPVVKKAIETLDELGVPRTVRVLSAHRTPHEACQFAAAAREELAAEDSKGEAPALAQEPWLINVKGKLLEPAPADSRAIAVTGLAPVAPQAGDMVEVPKSEGTKLSALTSLLEAVQEAGLTGQVSAVQLSSTQLTLRYLDRFDVKMKLNADFSYDLRLMETVRLQIEEKYSVDAAGSIDLTQSGYDAVYAPAS